MWPLKHLRTVSAPVTQLKPYILLCTHFSLTELTYSINSLELCIPGESQMYTNRVTRNNRRHIACIFSVYIYTSLQIRLPHLKKKLEVILLRKSNSDNTILNQTCSSFEHRPCVTHRSHVRKPCLDQGHSVFLWESPVSCEAKQWV